MKDRLRLDHSRLLGFRLAAQAHAQQKLSDPRIGAKIGKVPNVKAAPAKARRSV